MKQHSKQFCARKSWYFCPFLQFQAPKSCYFCPFLLAMHCNVRCALRYLNMTLEILTRQPYTYFYNNFLVELHSNLESKAESYEKLQIGQRWTITVLLLNNASSCKPVIILNKLINSMNEKSVFSLLVTCYCFLLSGFKYTSPPCLMVTCLFVSLFFGNLLSLFTFQQIHTPTLLDGLLTCSQNIIWWTV